jgi:hypothetical protein
MITTHVYIGTSLDGFIARRDGSFDWLSKYADRDAVEAYKEFVAKQKAEKDAKKAASVPGEEKQ